MDSIVGEDVARILKGIWLTEGEIAPAAFTLRPNIHETYISVLRESMPTFRQDAFIVARKKSIEQLKSHAGIFIAVNGHNIIGGEPFQNYMRQRGIAEETLLIDISQKLANLAKKNIKTLKI